MIPHVVLLMIPRYQLLLVVPMGLCLTVMATQHVDVGRMTFPGHFSFISAVTTLDEDKVGIIAGAVTKGGIKVFQVSGREDAPYTGLGRGRVQNPSPETGNQRRCQPANDVLSSLSTFIQLVLEKVLSPSERRNHDVTFWNRTTGLTRTLRVTPGAPKGSTPSR